MRLQDYPVLIFFVSFTLLWFANWVGTRLRAARKNISEEERPDFDIILGAALTLLGLVIGFSFSMAVGRYDQRKNYEEAEANAIGTEYLRADLLPKAYGARVRELLRQYLDLRIEHYGARSNDDLRRIDADTARVQGELWTAASGNVKDQQPISVVTLTVGGMNDVLNSQGYTEAAWRYRVPEAAWMLLLVTAICCCVLFGFQARRVEPKLAIVLPLLVAIALFLIADIDSPRRGMVRVHPQNLESLRDSLH